VQTTLSLSFSYIDSLDYRRRQTLAHVNRPI
jgi:hypothetical protein